MDSVFLVDDDAAIRRSLSRVLRSEGWKVEAFESADAFLSRADRERRGCIVLDVAMPGLDGLGLQQCLVQAGRPMPIVFLTGHGDIPMTVQAIKAGAADFLTKPVASQILVGAVRAAIERDESALVAREAISVHTQRLAKLTPREREVLLAVLRGRLNKQIASDLGIVEQTVKFHRARIMERMQARTAAELIHIATQLGLNAAHAGVSAPSLPPEH
jgi:FixJ family two-component response regulator